MKPATRLKKPPTAAASWKRNLKRLKLCQSSKPPNCSRMFNQLKQTQKDRTNQPKQNKIFDGWIPRCACRRDEFWHDSVHAQFPPDHPRTVFNLQLIRPRNHALGFGMAFHARRSRQPVRASHESSRPELD